MIGKRFACLLAAVALTVALPACIVEKKTPEKSAQETAPPPAQQQATPGEKGPFEQLGAQMDKGAKKLDEHLSVGAERLGEAMQKAGKQLEETAEEARARREREKALNPEPDAKPEADTGAPVGR